ncbi:MAG: hypothetical protein Q8R82_07190 [Hyphomonadaceae bacterium]|nr:hypothetical protein [Hyphomonadaceae bacterium]
MKVKVLAREVHYDGRGRLKGETFEADDRWARGRLLLRQIEEVVNQPVRKAHVAPPAAPVPAPEPKPEVEAPKSEASAPPLDTKAFDHDGDGRGPLRTYRTRRLKAED